MCLDPVCVYPEGALTGTLLSASDVELALLEDAVCVLEWYVCVCVQDAIS